MFRPIICASAAAVLAFSCGQKGPEGPQGPAGPTGPTGPGFTSGPSVSAVVPAQVTQGSEYDITLSGFATEWTDSTTVSFGMGITVTRTKAASPTSLLVHVRVAPDAKADTRDVSVTTGADTLFWRNGFSVLDRVKFTALGTASQMSLSVVRLEVNEPGFEFDTSTSSGNFVGISVQASSGFPVSVLSASAKVVDVAVFANADAGIGAYDLNVTSREGELAERMFKAPQVFTVTELAAQTLITGIPANGTVEKAFQSTAYRYQPEAVDGGAPTTLVTVQSSAMAVTPKVALLPSNGRWPSLISFASSALVPPATGDSYWLVVWEASGATGFSYTLSADPLARVAEEEPNDAFGEARQIAVPGSGAPAQLSSLGDADWWKVTATAADVGKRFHVKTQPGDATTDTVLEVFMPDGTTSLGGESDDFGLHEDHFSTAIPMVGDYYVKVTFSSFVSTFDATESHYELLVTAE